MLILTISCSTPYSGTLWIRVRASARTSPRLPLPPAELNETEVSA